MYKLFPYFPLSATVQPGNVKSLVLSVVIYLVASAVLGILNTVLGWIPLAGALVRIICGLLGLYCVIGIVLAVVKFIAI